MQPHLQTTRPTLKAPPAQPASNPTHNPTDPAIRRASNLAALREMIDLGMQMARAAAAEVLQPEAPEAAPEPPPKPARAATPPSGRRFRSADPHLAFSRTTRAVRQAIALETRIADGTLARSVRYTPSDPTQILLRKTLHDAVRNEPDRAARTQLCRHIDERLDAEFRDHPEARIEETLVAIANQLGLHLDFKKLPDELLGIAPAPTTPTRTIPSQDDSPAADPARIHIERIDRLTRRHEQPVAMPAAETNVGAPFR